MPKLPTEPEALRVRAARLRAKRAAHAAKVREVCSRLPRREAAAELGITSKHLGRLCARYGIAEAERQARRARVREALEYSNTVAAAMLGVCVDQVRWLRRRHAPKAGTSQPEARS